MSERSQRGKGYPTSTAAAAPSAGSHWLKPPAKAVSPVPVPEEQSSAMATTIATDTIERERQREFYDAVEQRQVRDPD